MFETKRLKRRLAAMPLPTPFTIDGLVDGMAERSGRSIRLIEIDPQPDDDLRTACGLRARLGETTYVLYRRRPTENQTRHTILHELAHEWLDHGTTLSPEDLGRLIPDSVRSTLLQRLGPDMVVQARARYGTHEEKEAELSASLIKDMVRTLAVGDDMVSLLETTLTHPVAHSRPRRPFN